MGLTLCEDYDFGSYHASVSYDILTPKQGAIFLGYFTICLLFESVFLFLTIRYFCSDTKLRSNIYAVVFYVSFHLSLVTTALHFLGGIVCFNYKVYNFLSTASYLLQGTGVFFVTMNMLDALLPLWCPDATCAKYLFLPIFALYAGGFLVFFMMELRNNKLSNFYLFNFYSSLILAIGFYLVVRQLSTELLLKFPSMLPPTRQVVWQGVATSITSLMLARAGCAFLDYMGLQFYLKNHNLALFTLYSIGLSLLFDILPCIGLLYFIKVQTQSTERSKSIGEIMSSLEGKATGFSKPGSDTLMEEMVAGENAKEDSL